MKIEITRKIEFCAGHRVWQHESKCSNMHGHNYTLNATFTADQLDSLGRVVDFSVIKERLKTWIDDKWDHSFLFYEKDEELLELEKVAPKNKPWYKCPFNPTAENMAAYLLKEIIPGLFSDLNITCTEVELHETSNCKAIVRI